MSISHDANKHDDTVAAVDDIPEIQRVDAIDSHGAQIATDVAHPKLVDGFIKQPSLTSTPVAQGVDALDGAPSLQTDRDLDDASAATSIAQPDVPQPDARGAPTGHEQPRRQFFGLPKNTRRHGMSAVFPSCALGLIIPTTGYVNTDDYEEKYEPDPHGEEAGPNARIWRVYLDEANAYDVEMVEQWKDTVDMLLVFVSVFG